MPLANIIISTYIYSIYTRQSLLKAKKWWWGPKNPIFGRLAKDRNDPGQARACTLVGQRWALVGQRLGPAFQKLCPISSIFAVFQRPAPSFGAGRWSTREIHQFYINLSFKHLHKCLNLSRTSLRIFRVLQPTPLKEFCPRNSAAKLTLIKTPNKTYDRCQQLHFHYVITITMENMFTCLSTFYIHILKQLRILVPHHTLKLPRGFILQVVPPFHFDQRDRLVPQNTLIMSQDPLWEFRIGQVLFQLDRFHSDFMCRVRDVLPQL